MDTVIAPAGRSGGRTGRWLLVAVLGAFVTLALLAAFAQSFLLWVDEPVQRWVISVRRGWLNDFMIGVSWLGTRYVIGGLLAIVTAWSLVTGRCRRAVLVLLVAFALNPLLEWSLKALVDRPRPDLLLLGRGRGPSFPSGHVLASFGFYAMLPALIPWDAGRRRSLGVAIVGVGVVLAVAFSRVYMGVHWTSDVVGGLLVGTIAIVATYRALDGHRIAACRCRARWPATHHPEPSSRRR